MTPAREMRNINLLTSGEGKDQFLSNHNLHCIQCAYLVLSHAGPKEKIILDLNLDLFFSNCLNDVIYICKNFYSWWLWIHNCSKIACYIRSHLNRKTSHKDQKFRNVTFFDFLPSSEVEDKILFHEIVTTASAPNLWICFLCTGTMD